MKTHKAIIDALTVIINNWDQLEEFQYGDIIVIDNKTVPIHCGICGLVCEILYNRSHETKFVMDILCFYGNQWREEFYGITEILQCYWIANLIEFQTTENHFTNIKRLHACIWIRNKLIDAINNGDL